LPAKQKTNIRWLKKFKKGEEEGEWEGKVCAYFRYFSSFFLFTQSFDQELFKKKMSRLQVLQEHLFRVQQASIPTTISVHKLG
jgi:hypothetical protein